MGKSIPAVPQTPASLFFSNELKESLSKTLQGNYESAITQYTQILKKESNIEKKKYVLAKMAECYLKSDKTGFSDILQGELSRNSELYPLSVELNNMFLLKDNKYNDVAGNLITLVNSRKNKKGELDSADATAKYALYNLGSIYFNSFEDSPGAKEYFDQLKKNYPNDPLTIHCKLMLGDIDSITAPLPKPFGKAIAQKQALPQTFEIKDNYPNPFNPSTVIEYQIPSAAHITLKVYDVLGREVSNLVNDIKEAGYHSVTFDGSGLSSGIYFARFMAQPVDELNQPFVQVRKMIFAK